MIDAEALHEAEQQALGQLAQMDLSLATRLHGLAMSTDDPKEVADHVRSYQRASRCVRQTIMLRAKLRHDRERHLIAITPTSRTSALDDILNDDGSRHDPVEMRIDGRIEDLQEAASRIVAKASPGMPRLDRLDALDRIDAWIDREVEEHPDFGTEDLDEHVLTLCRAMDLPEALGRRFRDLPRAPYEEDDTDPRYNFAAKPPRRETG
jgi:hypothetical protein